MGTTGTIVKRIRGVVMFIAGGMFLYAGYPPVTGESYAFIGLGVIIAVGGLVGIAFPERLQSQTGNESME